MFKGVNLTLLMGPVVPIPAPRPIIEALDSVQVTTSSGNPSGFQLTFSISSKSSLNTFLLLLPKLGPTIRTIIAVTMNGSTHVLMDGVVTNQEVSPDIKAGQSKVTLSGSDLTAVMNLIDFSGFPFPAMPDEAKVLFIIGKYAVFGLIPKIIPAIFRDVPIPINRIEGQKGKDLEYVNCLAGQHGYVFYIEPGPTIGTNVAYWGPEIKLGLPQPALNLNMDAFTNVESLSFNFDAESKTLPIVYIHNKETKTSIPIPIPDITPLNPPLGVIPPIPSKLEKINETGKMSPMRAIGKGLAAASRSSDAVTGNGKLDVTRYGCILKARRLVGVRGVGQAFNGLYYVKSVTHEIKKGEYKQSFSLTRNGLVSITPTVPV